METHVEEEKDDQLCKNPNCKASNLSSSHPDCLLEHRWTHICVCVSCWDSLSFTLSYTSTISTQLTVSNSFCYFLCDVKVSCSSSCSGLSFCCTLSFFIPFFLLLLLWEEVEFFADSIREPSATQRSLQKKTNILTVSLWDAANVWAASARENDVVWHLQSYLKRCSLPVHRGGCAFLRPCASLSLTDCLLRYFSICLLDGGRAASSWKH